MGWRNPLTGALKGGDAGALRSIFESIENYFKAAVPPGVILSWAGTTAPNGEWLLCDGAAVSRIQYAALYQQIGTNFGSGDGSTTFNVPDLRGRVPVTLDNLGGTDAGRLSVANTLGGSGGAQTHTLTVSEMPAHTHGVSGASVAFTFGAPNVAASNGASVQSESKGGGGAHNNMQPYLLLGAIIKV